MPANLCSNIPVEDQLQALWSVVEYLTTNGVKISPQGRHMLDQLKTNPQANILR